MTKKTERKETWLFKYYSKKHGGGLVAVFVADPNAPDGEEHCYGVTRGGGLSTLATASLYEVELTGEGDQMRLTGKGKNAPRYKEPWEGAQALEYVARSQDALRRTNATKAEATQRRKGMARFENMTLAEAKWRVQKANFAGKLALKSQIDLYLSGAR